MGREAAQSFPGIPLPQPGAVARVDFRLCHVRPSPLFLCFIVSFFAMICKSHNGNIYHDEAAAGPGAAAKKPEMLKRRKKIEKKVKKVLFYPEIVVYNEEE